MNSKRSSSIVGYVDVLGYLRCIACIDESRQCGTPVHADSVHAAEDCDSCRSQVRTSAAEVA